MGLFSDKKWLELIWVSNSKFVVFFIFSKNWKFLKMCCKNLCEKVSKIKNWTCTFYSFFRALCRGVLCFFCWCIFHGENCEKKSPFFSFFQKSQNRRFCFTIFSMKNALTEKQSTPRWRTRKNEEDGSLQFFRRPPESGLILHTSCVIYDSGRLADTSYVTRFWLLIG